MTALRRLFEWACWGSAAAAGAIVLAMSATVGASVVMRAVGVGGIRGDFELIEVGCGVAAFLFLPLCQFRRGHISVDIFSTWLPRRLNVTLEGLWQLLFAAAWIALGWRLIFGMMESYGYHERTMLLRLPVWVVYLPALFGSALSALVAVWLSWAVWRDAAPERAVPE